MQNENILYKIRVSLIIALAIFVQMFNFNLKDVYHIDELFSYGMANGENGVYIYQEIQDIDNKLLKGEVFHNYLTQTPNSSYKKTIKQVKTGKICLKISGIPLFFATFLEKNGKWVYIKKLHSIFGHKPIRSYKDVQSFRSQEGSQDPDRRSPVAHHRI
jgi:hypothetical protein